MATKQKSRKDPELAAFSAVEFALAGDLNEVAAEPAPKKDAETAAELEPEAEREASPVSHPDPVELPEHPAFVSPNRAAVANDDRRNAGIFLQSLQRRPSRTAYVWAFVLSLAWLGSFGAFAWSQGFITSSSLTTVFSPIQIFFGGCALLLPILAFFMTAILAVRAQEIRLASRAIGEAAIHLAQPESLTTDAVLTVSQTIRREVAAIGDGVERAIARAGELETLVRNEISTLERAYFDNEVRIHSLIDELNVQREAIISNADRVRTTMAGSHETMVADMERLAGQVADMMNSAGDRVTSLFDERGTQIHKDISTAGINLTNSMENKVSDIATVFERTGQMLIQHLHEGAGSVTRTLAQTGKEVIDTLTVQGTTVRQALEITTETLETRFITRGKEVTDRLALTGQEVSDMIASQGSNVRNILEATAADLENNFVRRGYEVSEKLIETGDIVTGYIGSSINQLHEVATEATANIGKEIVGNSARLSEELTVAGNRIVGEMVTRGREISESLDSASQRVSDTVLMHGQNLEHNLATIGERVATQVASQIDSLKNTFDITGMEFVDSLQKNSEEAKANLANAGRDVVMAMENQGTRINDSLRMTAESLASVVEERGKEVHEALSGRLNDFDTVITRGVDAVSHISGEVSGLTTVISAHLNEMDHLISVKGQYLTDSLVAKATEAVNHVSSLSERAEEMSAIVTGQIDKMEEHAERRSTEITANFDALVSRVDQALAARSNTISETLVARTSEMAKAMARSGADVAQELEARAAELGQSVAAKSALLAETLSSAAEELNSVLGNRATEIAQTLDSRVTDIETRVVNRLEAVTESLEEKGRSTSGMLGSRIAELSELFDNRGSALFENIGLRLGQMSALVDNSGAQFMESLNARVADIDRLFDSNSSSLMSSLGTRIGEIGDVFEVGSENVVNRLNSRFAEINTAFDSRSADIVDNISQHLSQVGEILAAKGGEISGKILAASSKVENTLSESAGSAINALTNVNDTLRNEMSDVFERLNLASGMLQSISSSASENLGSVGETLSERIRQIEAVLGSVTSKTELASGQLAQHLQALHQISAATMGHADSLATTTTDLENVSERLAVTLGERQQQLGNLLSAATSRSSDIEAIAEHFTSTISSSLQQMEQQYARLRNASDAQGQRIAEGMMGAYQTAAGEMNQTLASAAAQFRDSMDELRMMTGNIRKELDETRAELQKGAVELPHKTQETAANMRRVVTDQIKALSELSTLVTRSNRALDAEVEQKQQARAVAGMNEAVRVTPVSAHFPEKAMTQPQMTSVAQVSSPINTPIHPGPEQTAPMPPASGKGWLSDLLNRASQDDDHGATPTPQSRERSRRNSLESLDSISVDIARMIDHTAAVELWDRYKRGERNVFTRRLYTLQGQQTFEDIRRKYGADNEFRQTVDRYIGEFERLLAEVAQDDRDSILTNTYLTSETGKVYTMLAHAAGRLQ